MLRVLSGVLSIFSHSSGCGGGGGGGGMRAASRRGEKGECILDY